MVKKDIESTLHEERLFPPPVQFAARARLKPADLAALHASAKQDYVGFWANLARRELAWLRPFTQTLDDSAAPNYRWFTDGRLNVPPTARCPSREARPQVRDHVRRRAGRHATLTLSRAARRSLPLRERAERLKASQGRPRRDLHADGARSVIAMLACARIGAMHSVVFGGFSANLAEGSHRGCRGASC